MGTLTDVVCAFFDCEPFMLNMCVLLVVWCEGHYVVPCKYAHSSVSVLMVFIVRFTTVCLLLNGI